MANGAFGSGFWGIVVIGGFIILGLALAFAKLRNRTTPEQDRRTEQATREMYRQQNEDDRGMTP